MWLELKTHINSLNDNGYTSNLLKDMYNDDKNYIYLTYLSSVLYEVQSVNLTFEAADLFRFFAKSDK